MRVMISGSRDYANLEKVFAVLNAVHQESPITLLIHGDAKGADSLADSWAIEHKVERDPHPANWYPDGKTLDRCAGVKRNSDMVNLKPDLLIAFPLPQSKGTWDAVKKAEKARIKIILVESNKISFLNC